MKTEKSEELNLVVHVYDHRPPPPHVFHMYFVICLKKLL